MDGGEDGEFGGLGLLDAHIDGFRPVQARLDKSERWLVMGHFFQ